MKKIVKMVLGFVLVYSFYAYPISIASASESIINQYADLTSLYTKQETELQPHIIEHGSREKKQIALTFDADMTNSMSHELEMGVVDTYADKRVINFLMQNHISSTIFLTGLWIEKYPNEAQMMAESPLFELANHSYSHPSFAGECFGLGEIPESQYVFEIQKTQQLLKELTHKDNKYFRFPGGCYSDTVRDLVQKQGLLIVHWDTVAHDGFNHDANQITTNVLSNIRNGSILVMHLGGESNTPKTYEALQIITKELKSKGFEFVTISQLLKPVEEKKTALELSSYLVRF